MNILMLNYEYPPLGGGGGVVHELIAESLARNHSVWVITTAFSELPRQETRNGVHLLRVPVLGRRKQATASLASLLTYPPIASWHAWRMLRSGSFDVINSHFAVPTGVASVVPAWLHGTPHVLTVYGGDIYDPSKRLSPHRYAATRWVVRRVLASADRVVADSANIRDNVRLHYRYQGHIDVIPLGIRQPKFSPSSREALGLPREAVLAITVGRLVRRKRVEHLLAALATPGCDELYLVVVGTGPEERALHDAAGRLGVARRVHFTGRVSEERKWQLLAASDLYASATMHEGFGLVYLEAMTASLPVVTYDEGGHLDFLQDGVTGRLVPEGDVQRLAAAMANTAAAPDQRRRIGEHNRQVSRKHDVEFAAQQYEELFTAAVREHSVSGTAPPPRALERRG